MNECIHGVYTKINCQDCEILGLERVIESLQEENKKLKSEFNEELKAQLVTYHKICEEYHEVDELNNKLQENNKKLRECVKHVKGCSYDEEGFCQNHNDGFPCIVSQCLEELEENK